MKSYGRLKESLKSGLYILVGLVALYLITIRLQTLNIDDETVIVSKEIEEQSPTTNEIEIQLSIDKIYTYISQTASEENITELIKNYTPGGVYLTKVKMDQDAIHKVYLTYVVEQNTPILNKSKKDQIALLDASILMSLYPQIDTIQVDISVESELYRKVLYRPDIEDYFGISIATRGEGRTFERIASEFLNTSCVSQYINMRHPYDSLMGEVVENFYKMNFPVVEGEEAFVYIDESAEEELVKAYGYKLFIQGLAYENPLMNYYSAYRLVEYYESTYKEEIMLELATCLTKTDDERVKQACQKIIDLLAPCKEEIKVLDRFTETSSEGGRKLYKVDKDGLKILAKWKGKETAGLKIISQSPSKEYVLCEVVTAQNRYRYILSCKQEGTYRIDEKGSFINEIQSCTELMSLIRNRVKNQSDIQNVQASNIRWEWYLGDLMCISIGDEIELIYNIQTDKIHLKSQYMENFGLGELEQYLEEIYENVKKVTLSEIDSKAYIKKFTVDGEVLTVYAYDSIVQKNMELSAREGQAQNEGTKMWNQGKLIIYYNGNKQEIIKGMNQLLL